MLPKLKLKKESDTRSVNATNYRSLVGSLRYLVNTRPDIAFSIRYVSKFMEDPHEEHFLAVKHILRYVAGTYNLGLFYPRNNGKRADLLGYTNSDLDDDLESR
jgi:hypothetical protein